MTDTKRKLTFYLAHPFSRRTEIRDWELQFEYDHNGIDLINPFFDLDRDDRVNGHFPPDHRDPPEVVVNRDLKAIESADGLLAFADNTGGSFGTAMEIVYARQFDKLVVIVAENDTHKHPWLVYHADFITGSYADLSYNTLHELVQNRELIPTPISMDRAEAYVAASREAVNQIVKNSYMPESAVGSTDTRKVSPEDMNSTGVFNCPNDLDNPIKDSGHRRTFETGAQRDRASGKGMPGLISPFALRRLALHLEHGAAKYDRRNWEKGMPVEDYIESLLRHTLSIMEGATDEDHEAAVMFNIMGIIHTREMIKRGVLPKSLDYEPQYGANSEKT